MKRSQLVQISDLVVLASIVAILGSLSVVVAALLVGALGLWLGLVRRSRRYPKSRDQSAGLARCRRVEREMMSNSADPLSPAHLDG
jgi:hypothetical protein